MHIFKDSSGGSHLTGKQHRRRRPAQGPVLNTPATHADISSTALSRGGQLERGRWDERIEARLRRQFLNQQKTALRHLRKSMKEDSGVFPCEYHTMDSTRLLESLSRSKEWTQARYKGTPHTHLISFVKTDVLFHGLRWAFLAAIHPWGKQTITHIHTHAHARTHAHTHTHTRWNIISPKEGKHKLPHH